VRCIGRHKKSQDLVLKAEVLELSCLVAAMAIKDQESLLTIGMPFVLIEVLNPLKSKGIISLAIIANSNLPGSRKASLVLFGLMDLCRKDDEW
jgi:hypothetical protein